MFVAGWRHALWSEWPFIIIIIIKCLNIMFIHIDVILVL